MYYSIYRGDEAGTDKIRVKSHSDGLMTLGEAIAEVTRQKAIQMFFDITAADNKNQHETVESYFVISFPFNIIKRNGELIPAGAVGRQSHVNHFEGYKIPSALWFDKYSQMTSSGAAIDFGNTKNFNHELFSPFGKQVEDVLSSNAWIYAHDTAIPASKGDRRAVDNHINDMLYYLRKAWEQSPKAKLMKQYGQSSYKLENNKDYANLIDLVIEKYSNGEKLPQHLISDVINGNKIQDLNLVEMLLADTDEDNRLTQTIILKKLTRSKNPKIKKSAYQIILKYLSLYSKEADKWKAMFLTLDEDGTEESLKIIEDNLYDSNGKVRQLVLRMLARHSRSGTSLVLEEVSRVEVIPEMYKDIAAKKEVYKELHEAINNNMSIVRLIEAYLEKGSYHHRVAVLDFINGNILDEGLEIVGNIILKYDHSVNHSLAIQSLNKYDRNKILPIILQYLQKDRICWPKHHNEIINKITEIFMDFERELIEYIINSEAFAVNDSLKREILFILNRFEEKGIDTTLFLKKMLDHQNPRIVSWTRKWALVILGKSFETVSKSSCSSVLTASSKQSFN